MADLSLDDQIIVAIRRVSQSVDRYSRYLWQGYGLTAPQLGTLRELQQLVSATPSLLAERLHISPATMAGILKRLGQRRLVSRVRDEHDRRSIVIRITKAGDALADRAPSLLRDRFREKLNKLPLWERSQLLAMLQRTAEMMDADEIDETPFLFHGPAEQAGPSKKDKRGKRGPKQALTAAKK